MHSCGFFFSLLESRFVLQSDVCGMDSFFFSPLLQILNLILNQLQVERMYLTLVGCKQIFQSIDAKHSKYFKQNPV